jgi:hypothetical protein
MNARRLVLTAIVASTMVMGSGRTVGASCAVFEIDSGFRASTSECMAWPVEEAKEQLQWLERHPSSRP